jgi:electron transport complex protein RnfE
LRKIIPDDVRLPAFIVVVASLVTVVEMITQAYMSALYESLGLYIPLIVVNCIILGRAEAFASKNGPVASIFDGVGMGVGFTVALVIIGFLREFIGTGAAFGVQILPESYPGIGIFTNAPGAFMVMAFVVAVMNKMNIQTRANEVVEDCDGCCANCSKCKSKE